MLLQLHSGSNCNQEFYHHLTSIFFDKKMTGLLKRNFDIQKKRSFRIDEKSLMFSSFISLLQQNLRCPPCDNHLVVVPILNVSSLKIFWYFTKRTIKSFKRDIKPEVGIKRFYLILQGSKKCLLWFQTQRGLSLLF